MKHVLNDPALKNLRRQLRRNLTDAERVLWARLRNRQFFGMRFFRQYSVGPYIIDFYCPTLRLAIELDGGQHNEAETKAYDEARSEFLCLNGIEVVRYWNNDVIGQIEAVLGHLSTAVERLTPPNLPLP